MEMGILEEKKSHLQCLQGPVASFAVTGKRRRMAGQDTQRSANLINACRSSQHLLPVSKTHEPRCSQHILEDGSDPSSTSLLGFAVCAKPPSSLSLHHQL